MTFGRHVREMAALRAESAALRAILVPRRATGWAVAILAALAEPLDSADLWRRVPVPPTERMPLIDALVDSGAIERVQVTWNGTVRYQRTQEAA